MTQKNLTVVETPPRRDIASAGHRPAAIVPTTVEEAYRLARIVAAAGLAPKDMKTADQIAVAMMHGMEVGMPPMMAVQRIAVINGRPTIWGDAALGMVRASGLCKYIKEWIEGEGDARVAYCETWRQGDPESVTRSFSVENAKDAKLLAKDGPWQTYRARMLQARARSFCLRDVYPDVLGGLYMREEFEGHEEKSRRERPNPNPAPIEGQFSEAPPIEGTVTVQEEEPPKKPQRPNPNATLPAPKEEPKDGLNVEEVRSNFITALHEARNDEGCEEAWKDWIEPVKSQLPESDLREITRIYRVALGNFL